MPETWWNIPSESLPTPLSILRKQATALTEVTRGQLQGDVLVKPQPTGGNALIHLRIVVPALNNFTYSVTTYSQPVLLYPGDLFANEKWRRIENADEFEKNIYEILSSEATGKIVSSLLAQANDAS